MADIGTLEAASPAKVRELYEKDQEVLRKTFFKNEDLLRAMSNIMLGTCKSAAEKGLLKATFADPEVFAVVKRRFLPSLEDPMTLGQAKDSWSGINVDIAGRLPEHVRQFVEYKQKLITMTEDGVQLFRNPEGKQVDLTIDVKMLDTDPLGSGILARSQYILNVNQQISFLWIAGNQKKEEDKPQTAAAGANKVNASGKPLAAKK